MKKVFRIFDTCIESFENAVCLGTLSVIIVLAFVQVVLRYFFGKTLPWSEEVIAALMVLMAMAGAARGVRVKAHTQLDGVSNALPRALSIGLKAITSVITLAFLALLTWSSWMLYTRSAGLKTPYLRIPYSLCYIPLFAGGGLMAYEFIKLLKERIISRPKPAFEGQAAVEEGSDIL